MILIVVPVVVLVLSVGALVVEVVAGSATKEVIDNYYQSKITWFLTQPLICII